MSFNPRPRAGGDMVASPPESNLKVSIHAPARGATSTVSCRGRCYAGFNPRPRAGGDIIQLGYTYRRYCFNPRPRAGGDYNRGQMGGG